MSPDLKDADADAQVAVTKDELHQEHNPVRSEGQSSAELRCVESSGHNREGENSNGRTGRDSEQRV